MRRRLLAVAALVLASVGLGGGQVPSPTAAPAPVEAYGMRICTAGARATVPQSGAADCQIRDSYGSVTEIRVMIICTNEIGSTGWLYGGWITTPNIYSVKYCPSSTYTISTVTYQAI